MNADFGELIVHWTARLAVAAYLVRLGADVAGWPANRTQRARTEQRVRLIWTSGCLVHLLHVAAAFESVHHWSHAAAAAHTAEQTARVTGWQWSGGVWINYAFTLWWPLDVVWCWRRGLDRLPRTYIAALHAVVGFLVFNATAVFGPGWWWLVVGCVAAALLTVTAHRLAVRRQSHSR